MMHRKTSSRRGVLRGAAMLGMASAVPALRAARAEPVELSSLRTDLKSWLWAPEDFASAGGLFGSNLKIAMAATNRGVNQDALIGGATDILLGAPQQNLRVQVRGRPIKMICGFVNKFASHVVVSKVICDKAGISEQSPPAAKAALLKGLRIGTTGPGGGPDQLVRYLIRSAGLVPDKDAQLVVIRGGPQGMLAALQGGQIDGFCLSSPTSDVAVDRFGAAYLFNMTHNPPPALANFLYITASVMQKTIDAHPEELTAYCLGIARALKIINDDPQAYRKWAETWFTGMEPKLFEEAWRSSEGMYMRDPVPTEAQFALTRSFLADELAGTGQPPIPPDFGFKDAFDLRFVNDAMKQL